MAGEELPRRRSGGSMMAREGTCRYSHDEVVKAAEDAVGLFIEYRDVHGFCEEDARLQALAEVAEGTSPGAYDDIDELRLREWQAEETELDRQFREYKRVGGPLVRGAWERLWQLHIRFIDSDRISPYEERLLL